MVPARKIVQIVYKAVMKIMSKGSNNFLSKIKPVLNEVEESLPYIKDIFLTPIAWGFALGERYLKEVSKRQEEAKKQMEII